MVPVLPTKPPPCSERGCGPQRLGGEARGGLRCCYGFEQAAFACQTWLRVAIAVPRAPLCCSPSVRPLTCPSTRYVKLCVPFHGCSLLLMPAALTIPDLEKFAEQPGRPAQVVCSARGEGGGVAAATVTRDLAAPELRYNASLRRAIKSDRISIRRSIMFRSSLQPPLLNKNKSYV